jgi:hypothetical protein
MTIRYGWDIETVCAESEDILDHDHRDKLSDYGMEELIHAINQDVEPGNNYTRLVLVRDRLDDGGVVCRSWAYVTDEGEMPEQFLDAYDNPVAKVPPRFIEEFKR